MKKLRIMFLLIFLLLFVSACNHVKEPQINIEVLVSQLSLEEFDYVGTDGLDQPSKDDFRKLICVFEVKHPKGVTRQIEFPEPKNWRKAINTIDDNKNRYWFANAYEQNNEGENFANYEKELVFYSKGLNESEIRNAFDSVNFKLSLTTAKGEDFKDNYQVSDFIKFNKN